MVFMKGYPDAICMKFPEKNETPEIQFPLLSPQVSRGQDSLSSAFGGKGLRPDLLVGSDS